MLFLIFVLFPATFGLQCMFMDYDSTSTITSHNESSIFNPRNAASSSNCTDPNDKCFAGSFLKTLNSTTTEYIILQMCLSDALTNIRFYRLDVNVDCNKIMPVNYTSDDLLYSYRCCDKIDCQPPDLPTNNNPKPTVPGATTTTLDPFDPKPTDHKSDKGGGGGGAASTVFLSFSMLFVSLSFVLL